jgi:hypothetical protein
VVIRRPIGLEAVNADLSGRMHVPPSISPEWFDMAVITLCLATEKLIAAVGRGLIEAAR